MISNNSGKIVPLLIVTAFLTSQTGCKAPSVVTNDVTSNGPECDALHPEMIDVPVIAWNATFGGIVKPDTLAPHEMTQLLERRLPEPADVPGSLTLIHVIEKASGRTVVWERAADTDSGAPISSAEGWSYADSFSQLNRQPTLRDAIGVLLGRCNSGLVNSPIGIDYMFKNYVLINSRFIVILSLPVGAYRHPFEGIE